MKALTRLTSAGPVVTIGIIVVAIVVLAVIGGLFLAHNHAGEKQPPVSTSACTAGQLQIGSTGHCVRDAQTMVNFIETDGLSECPFTGGTRLTASGTYDNAAAAQVKTVQTWLNCYNKQEESGTVVPVDGVVGQATWQQLCSYAYQFPKQSHTSTSPYAKQTLVAGKDAGC